MRKTIAILLLLLFINPCFALNLKHETSFVAFSTDTNSNPPMVFGGKLLAEMDRCAGIAARRLLYDSPTGAKDAVTIAINEVTFHKSAKVKDLLFVSAKVVRLGEKSIIMEVCVVRENKGEREMIVSGQFIFVAYDLENQKAIPHGIILNGDNK